MASSNETASLQSHFAYSTMVRDLRDAIGNSKLAIGDRISGEVALSKQYDISVTSVRRGIELLVEDGLLTRRQGSGTYVCGRPQPDEPQAVRPTQRRDTIAILPQVQAETYHPFFSERLTALRTHLGQFGWATWEPNAARSTGQDLGLPPYVYQGDGIHRIVGEHPEFAGMLVRDWMVPEDADWGQRFPMVSMEVSDRFPFVAYDWRSELERGFRHLLSQGARKLWAMSVFEESWVTAAAQRAARALDLPPPTLHTYHSSNNERTLSMVVRNAYDATLQTLEQEQLDVDGILVGSDFETQGVIDALLKLGRSIPDDYHLLSMTNRESRLQSPWPLACLEADGYAQGDALATLIHTAITNPAQLPRRIVLSGTLRIS